MRIERILSIQSARACGNRQKSVAQVSSAHRFAGAAKMKKLLPIFLSILLFASANGLNRADAAWPDADTVVIFVLDVTGSMSARDLEFAILGAPCVPGPQVGATPELIPFARIDTGGRYSFRLHCTLRALLNLRQQADEFGYVKKIGLIFYPNSNPVGFGSASAVGSSGAASFDFPRTAFVPSNHLVAPDEVNASGQYLFDVAVRSVSQTENSNDAHIELPFLDRPSGDLNVQRRVQRLLAHSISQEGVSQAMVVILTDDKAYRTIRATEFGVPGLVPEIHIFTMSKADELGHPADLCAGSWDQLALDTGGVCKNVLDTEFENIQLPDRFGWQVTRNFLPVDPTLVSYAFDIDDHGNAVGGYNLVNGASRAALWTEGSTELTSLHPAGADASVAQSINNAGQVLLNSTTGGFRRAHIIQPLDSTGDGKPDTWYQDSNFDAINDLMMTLPDLGLDVTTGIELNENGTVIGQGQVLSGDTHAFVWGTDTGITDLGTLGGNLSIARAITSTSFNGVVDEVALIDAYTSTGEREQSFVIPRSGLWYQDVDNNNVNDAITPLGISNPDGFDLSQFSRIVRLIRPSGDRPIGMVGEAARLISSNPPVVETVPYFWSEDRSFVKIGNPGGLRGLARDINESGVVVGGAEDEQGVGRPFLWTEAVGRIDLGRLSSSRGTAFAATTTAGTAAGLSRNGNGVSQAAIWSITNTKAGESAKVVDPVTGVVMRFDNVLSPGTTSIITSSANPGPELPDPNFVFITPDNTAQYYNISTTASFDGRVRICIPYDRTSSETPTAYHLINGQWQPIQTYIQSAVLALPGSTATTNAAVCFYTSSFSWFAAGVNAEKPAADAGLYGTVACTSAAGALIALDGSGSTNPGTGTLSYHWSGAFGTASGISPTIQMPIGANEVDLVVSDGIYTSDPVSSELLVTVQTVGLEAPFAPLTSDEQESPDLPLHSFKEGRTLPLRLVIKCGVDVLGEQSVSPPKLVRLIRTGNAINMDSIDLDAGQSANETANFRFSGDSWVYNLNTRGLGTGTYQIDIELPDGVIRSAAFVLQ